jgi:hypothetical protein
MNEFTSLVQRKEHKKDKRETWEKVQLRRLGNAKEEVDFHK